MATPTDALKAGLASYFKSEEYSDCTIICGPYHFRVHKLVIGAHSDYFRTALKADTFQEGKTGEIELKATEPDSDDPEDACDDPEIVKLMVAYFYHLDYLHDKKAVIEVHDSPPPKKKVRVSAPVKRTRATNPLPSPEPVAVPAGPKVYLIEHAKVFAMAVKYHVDPLRDLATHKFRAEAEQHWDHEDLAQAFQLIYTSTADEITQLRSIAVEVLAHHRSDLLKKPEIATLLQSITGLAYDLLMRNPDNIPKPRYTMKSKGGEYRYIPCFNIAAHGDDTRTSSTKICKKCRCVMEVCLLCAKDQFYAESGYWNIIKCRVCRDDDVI